MILQRPIFDEMDNDKDGIVEFTKEEKEAIKNAKVGSEYVYLGDIRIKDKGIELLYQITKYHALALEQVKLADSELSLDPKQKMIPIIDKDGTVFNNITIKQLKKLYTKMEDPLSRLSRPDLLSDFPPIVFQYVNEGNNKEARLLFTRQYSQIDKHIFVYYKR